MALRPATLRQSDVTRCAKAMRDAEISEWRLIVHPDGRQEIIVGELAAQSDQMPAPDRQKDEAECDRLFGLAS